MAQPPLGEEGGCEAAAAGTTAAPTYGGHGLDDDGIHSGEGAVVGGAAGEEGEGEACGDDDEEAARERLKADISVHSVNVVFSR